MNLNIDIDKAHKFSWAMVIIGLLLMAVGAPIFRNFVTSSNLTSESGKTITESGATGIRTAYNYNFSLGTGESVTIDFSVKNINNTATIRIVSRANFILQFARSANGTTLTGLDFTYSHPTYGVNPTSGTVATLDASNTNSYIIEFGGGGVSSSGATARVISYPGDYTIVVFGTNGTNLVVNEKLMFDISVDKSFPGRTIAYYLNWIGFGLIIGFMAIAMLLLVKKTIEGRV